MKYRVTEKIRYVLLTGLMLAFLAAGCAMRFTELKHGMARSNVVDRLGDPSLRRLNEQGDTVWIYFDIPLDEYPRIDKVEGRRRVRLRLAEQNPDFFDSHPGAYRMTLFLTFDDRWNLVDSRYMVRRSGPFLPRHR